ncbi:MAG: N-acetyltransferase [Clostridia bacterium]|nr:N-acetyltransferase [Clostridia bacterium]
MHESVRYRLATPADADEILEIYRPYVESTAVTFETEVPSREAFRARVEHVLEQFPYVVAEADGQIVGYSYASPYRSRAGFRWTVELSVYVRSDLRGQGIGTRLFAALLDFLRMQGYRNAVSVISWPNESSARLHYHFGFRCAGIQLKCGYKNGHWCDVALFERCLGDYPDPPAEPIPFSSLSQEDVERVFKI